MFNIGWTELVVIAIAAFLFLKPEDMPKIARKVGVIIGKIKAYWNSVSVDFKKEIDELKSMADPLEGGGKKEDGEKTLKKEQGKEGKRV